MHHIKYPKLGSWPLHKWPEDGKQTLALLTLTNPEARAAQKACALERLARDLGYVRAKIDGCRRWISELQYLAMAERGEVQTYRFGSIRHTAARQKVAPERRHEIAVKGAAQRWADKKMAQLNVQVTPFHGICPSWAQLVQLPAREGQGDEITCQHCNGSGQYGRHNEQCRKCSGTGHARFVVALRAEPTSEKQLTELSNLLDSLENCKTQRTIRLHESGGGMTNTGRAIIVCGLQGEPLTSFGGRATCGSNHATFFAHAAMVITYGQHRGDGSGTVTLVAIDRTIRHHLAIEKTPLWSFNDNDEGVTILSPKTQSFEFPEAAVKAAQNKARCYHCRSAFYVAAGGAHGPSGALRGAGATFGGLPSPFKGPGIGYKST